MFEARLLMPATTISLSLVVVASHFTSFTISTLPLKLHDENSCGLPPLFSMYYFYILRSIKNKKLYLGYSPDLKARLISHNNGENKATKPNTPYEIIYYSGFINKDDAIKAEQYYKTTSGWKRIHKMLEITLDEAQV